MRRDRSGQAPISSIIDGVSALAVLAFGAVAPSCARASGPAATPGPEEARRAWRAVAGPAPKPPREVKPIDFGFLKPLFDFIERHRLAIGIVAGAALVAFAAWLIVIARRRSARGLPRLFASTDKKPTQPRAREADAAEPSAALYARALESAAGEDWSTASVFLRRARVAELVERGVLPAHREFGEAEIARAAETAGASSGAYRLLARAADAVLFGGREVGAAEWGPLLAAYAEAGAAP